MAEVEEQVISLNETVKKAEASAREKALETTIAEKQNQQMIKQLQNQLKIYTGSPLDSPIDCMLVCLSFLVQVKKGASLHSLSRSKFSDFSDNESSEELSNQGSPRGNEASFNKRIGRAETISHLVPRQKSRTSSPNPKIVSNSDSFLTDKNGAHFFAK